MAVVFALFLLAKSFSSLEIGSIISATLVEDAIVTALVSVFVQQIGLRALLFISSIILSASGLVFAFADSAVLIVATAIFGIISPAGYEGGPFAAVEQAVISKLASVSELAREFSFYNLIGFAGSAAGALLTGFVFPILQKESGDLAYKTVFLAYASGGFLMLLLYGSLKLQNLEKPLKSGDGRESSSASAILKSPAVRKLVFFQGLDAFGGGFIPATLIAYWFFERYDAGPEFTGPLFFFTNALAAVSFLLAPWVCKRFGLLNTMVFTHLPCSITLCLIPFMPDAMSAGLILVARSVLSSMDIPARQAYSMVLVHENQRTAVAGLTSAARSCGQCAAPLFSGLALANALSGLSFLLAGSLKTLYDLGIYFSLRNIPLKHSDSSVSSLAIEDSAG